MRRLHYVWNTLKCGVQRNLEKWKRVFSGHGWTMHDVVAVAVVDGVVALVRIARRFSCTVVHDAF